MHKLVTIAEVLALLDVFQLARADCAFPVNFWARLVEGQRDRLAILRIQSVWYALSDNGGELMLDRLNSDDLATNIPLTWRSTNLNAMTVADRVATALRGEPIDYDQRWSDEDQATVLNSSQE